MHKEGYTERGVIDRGNEIYRGWKKSKYSSRKIVGFVRSAVQRLNQRRTVDACLEALACLFALDIRVKQRYSSRLRRFFLYLSWRRETAALRWLKHQLNIPDAIDIRSMIEIELDSILARLGIEIEEDKDEQSKGGKARLTDEQNLASSSKNRNGDELEAGAKTNELAAKRKSTEKEPDQEITEDQPTEIKTAEQESAEQGDLSTASFQVKEDGHTQEVNGESLSASIHEEQELNSIKQENNGSENRSGPIKDITPKTQGYSNVVDSPPQILEGENARDEKKNFINEDVIDGAVLGKNDFAGNSYIEGGKNIVKDSIVDGLPSKAEQAKETKEKDGHLYDKIVLNAQKTSSASELSSAREPIKVDMQNDKENELRRAINDALSEQAIREFKAASEAEMRHQISVYCAEHGIVDPAVRVDSNAADMQREVPIKKAP